jgi:hypothetical protein
MLTKKYIAYLGITDPSTMPQIKVEITGLKYAIKIAEEQIASLEQAAAIAELQELNEKDLKDEKLDEKETENNILDLTSS